jgi:Ca2+-transporting ATPase
MTDQTVLSVDPVDSLFPLSTDTLAKLVDPKSPDLYKELGGLEGIAKSLHADPKRGLSGEVQGNETEERRIEKYAKNVLPPPPRETLLQLIFGALQDKILLLLIGAAIVSIILGSLPYTSDHPDTGWIDGVAILIAVVIVVCVTSGNDYQKQKQFQKLDAKKNDRVVKCIRNGDQMQVSIFDVRVGDVLMLETGDIVSADAIFISGHALKCDESALTGESDPIKKGHIEDGLDPFLISGSQVIEGVGNVLVIAVGVNSFNGRTMMALRVPDEDTPLQQKLEVLAGNIGKFGMAAAALLLLIGIPKYFIVAAVNKVDMSSPEFKKRVGSDIVRLIINAITIIVVAVPEGLPLAVTIALAYGMIKMLEDNNLVRHLAACETMGGATNICSDKTGTLTQNVMTVVTAWTGGKKFAEITERTGDQLSKDLKDALFQGIAVNSNAFEAPNQKGVMDFVGSKTECALLKFGKMTGYDYLTIRESFPVHQLYPFSSARKRMSTVVKIADGHYRIFTKGASEIVLAMCDRVMVVPDSGPSDISEVRPIDSNLQNHLKGVITEFATDALRTLCLAYADIHGEVDWSEPPEHNMTLLAIVGIRDPLRPEVPEAVATCQRAGITVRMVTGDNITTAENIAKAAGILKPGGICMEGPKFRELPQDQMDRIIPRLQVLARSSPTDKQLLVGRLKELGEVVAVTGDGTNDAPALKMADIGFSMGISGTEVAIAASDVVLLDDNFASIVKAALWGRNIFNAIRKFLQFQLTVNVVAVTLAFIGTLSGEHGESPLTAVQLLWVNLIMDSLAALSLATELPTPDLLNRKPVGRHAPLITRKMWRFIIIHAAFQLAIVFTLLYAGGRIFGYDTTIEQERVHVYTIIFNTFVMMQLFNELNGRMLLDELNMFKNILKNRFFIIIMIITFGVQVIFVELGGEFTTTVGLKYYEWFICIALGLLELPVGVALRFIPVEEKEEPANDLDLKYEASLGHVSSPSSSAGTSVVSAGSEVPHRRFRRWSLVRETVTQIAVINAFKAMQQERPYRVVKSADTV